MPEPIRLDEVLAELERLHRAGAGGGPDGFTSTELAEALRVCPTAALNRIRALVKAGLVAMAGWREGVGVSGRRCRSPVYRLTSR